MLLTGSPGSGKSTLIQSWLAGLEPKRFLPLLITQSSLSATGVLEVLLIKLGISARFKPFADLLLLEKHLADLDPVTLVLVLDDANNYPDPALEDIPPAVETRLSPPQRLRPHPAQQPAPERPTRPVQPHQRLRQSTIF